MKNHHQNFISVCAALHADGCATGNGYRLAAHRGGRNAHRWRGHWFLGLGRTEQPERQKHHHRERKAVIDFLYTRQVHVEKLSA